MILVKGHSDFKVKCLSFGLYTQVSDSGPLGPLVILLYPFSPLSPSLWETARYRLKYCLKGPLNPKQPTNQKIKTGLFLKKSKVFSLRKANSFLKPLKHQAKLQQTTLLCFYFYRLKKIRLDVSCESSSMQRIHMIYQVLFSLKINEKVFINVVCCSRDWRFKG